ncbi:polyketide cyclase [Flaviaesturariibacter flavus]|uniref:Polyketide cyclase n=1 Tax=Flaviaesturariibacter flavus TaxID=2502780 RepID=A0A4R1BJH8_9BACT|nr:SRPBCC family protein [Flaviaesturariibacter flavus]TCJ17515.1 polyketide cyclase [Flaviaesturariibacter flavus]
MRIVKRIFIAIAVLLLLALVAALFVPKEYTVERSIAINLPADSVFTYVKYLKNQNDYSKWAGMDPAMKKEFRGTDAQPGFVSAWESQQSDVGQGEQTIRSIDEVKRRVDYDLHFIKPMNTRCDAWMQVDPKGGKSEVVWGFHGRMPYPVNILLPLFGMEKAIGDDLSLGLHNLKERLETK